MNEYSLISRINESSKGVATEFNHILADLTAGEDVKMSLVAGIMAGLTVLANPTARKDLTDSDLFKELGIEPNTIAPQSLDLINVTDSVKSGVSLIGWSLAKDAASKYLSMLHRSVETQDFTEVTQAFANIIKKLKT